MKVNVFLHYRHAAYASSRVDDVRVVEAESPLLPGIRSVTTEIGDNWIEVVGVSLEDVEGLEDLGDG